MSGKLIMNALVMYDHQADTLWSQFLGRGLLGPLTGTDLDLVPLPQTTWSVWKATYPDTVVLDKRGRYQFDRYVGYYRSGDLGVTGQLTQDERLHAKALVVGVAVDGHAKAYSLGDLADKPIINDTVSGKEVVVFLERSTDTAIVYERQVNERPLTFELLQEGSGAQALLRDIETGTTWTALTGVAANGPLKGQTLTRVPSHLSFWFAWTDWNPDAGLYDGDG